MASGTGSISGVAAGVPFVAHPPATDRPDAPVVLAWHLQDAPRTETAFAAALPLAGLDAWRVYLGLPLSGSRLPDGGMAEFLRRGAEDAVGHIYGPVRDQAVAEAPPALAELRERFGVGRGPVALLGGSMGAGVAGAAVVDGVFDAVALVLVSPLVQLRPVVAAMGRRYGVDYPWAEASERIADRLDLVARVDELVAHGRPPTLLVVGELDDEAFRGPAAALRDALAARTPDPAAVELVTVPGMAHALAEEPGTEPAPQTEPAARVDALAVDWLRRHLPG